MMTTYFSTVEFSTAADQTQVQVNIARAPLQKSIKTSSAATYTDQLTSDNCCAFKLGHAYRENWAEIASEPTETQNLNFDRLREPSETAPINRWWLLTMFL